MDDFQITLVLAPIGTGKTCHAVRMAHKFWKKYPGSPVYTNIPDLTGAILIDITEVTKYRLYDKHSGQALLLLDECGTGSTNNRNFKNIPSMVLLWISMHRHEKVEVYLYSQAVDMDITFVRKMKSLIVLRKFGPWTYARRWFKDRKGETDLETGLPRYPWAPSPFPVAFDHIVYRPHWYKYFNTYWSPFEHLPDFPDSRIIGGSSEPVTE